LNTNVKIVFERNKEFETIRPGRGIIALQGIIKAIKISSLGLFEKKLKNANVFIINGY
jgi:hypothetical protein